MTKVILIYGSTTGNTEELTRHVAAGLKEGGMDVKVKNVTEAKTAELGAYDLIVLGCSTWYDGELQDDFVSFHEEMSGISLDGKKAAVFGPGNFDFYADTFCTAVDILEQRLLQCGAVMVKEGYKIDTPGDALNDDINEDARQWALKLAESL